MKTNQKKGKDNVLIKGKIYQEDIANINSYTLDPRAQLPKFVKDALL